MQYLGGSSAWKCSLFWFANNKSQKAVCLTKIDMTLMMYNNNRMCVCIVSFKQIVPMWNFNKAKLAYCPFTFPPLNFREEAKKELYIGTQMMCCIKRMWCSTEVIRSVCALLASNKQCQVRNSNKAELVYCPFMFPRLNFWEEAKKKLESSYTFVKLRVKQFI